MSFENDYEFGKEQEEMLLDLFRIVFDRNLKLSIKQFSKYDYKSNKTFIELKSRRIKFGIFKDVMISKDKIDWASLNSDKDIYFVFNFIDVICYWKYNKEDIIKGLIQFREGGRWDRGKREIKIYAFLDNSILIKI